MRIAKTHSEHQRDYRRRQVARGLCELKLWCFPEHRERIRRFAATLARTKRRRDGDLP